MNKYIADTMALILRLERRRMPQKARKIFEQAEKEQAEIIIPVIVFAEIAYLSEKDRIDTDLRKTRKYLDKFKNITECPLTFDTVKTAFDIDDIPELHDRLIAGTGKDLDVVVITNDPDIEDSRHVGTIWK